MRSTFLSSSYLPNTIFVDFGCHFIKLWKTEHMDRAVNVRLYSLQLILKFCEPVPQMTCEVKDENNSFVFKCYVKTKILILSR